MIMRVSNLSGPKLPSVKVSMYLHNMILVALLSELALARCRGSAGTLEGMFATFRALLRDSIFCVCVRGDF